MYIYIYIYVHISIDIFIYITSKRSVLAMSQGCTWSLPLTYVSTNKYHTSMSPSSTSVTAIEESCPIGEWVTPHMSHVTRGSCHTRVMSHIRHVKRQISKIHVPQLHVCHSRWGVMSHRWTSHYTHESCHTWVMLHMSHVTHPSFHKTHIYFEISVVWNDDTRDIP